MSFLYITADRVGLANHGGGSVTQNEAAALRSLGPCEVLGRPALETEYGEEPWKWDRSACFQVTDRLPVRISGYIASGQIGGFSGRSPDWPRPETFIGKEPKLAHFYAGTFSETVASLQRNGTKVTYTAAAHDLTVSRREHEKLGLLYNYDHLTRPELWKRYLQGYKDADTLIVPSTHSRDVMRGFGCQNRIEVIPHGVDLPKCRRCDGSGFEPFDTVRPDLKNSYACIVCQGSKLEPVKPSPPHFRVGYLGSVTAPDKGVRYLLEAWKKLNYKDATLVLAGHDSTSPLAFEMVRVFGGGNINLRGWVENVGDFYDDISLYVQPSASEGFGLEILEAMAHGRPVLASTGAGASDLLTYSKNDSRFASCDANLLAAYIDQVRKHWDLEFVSRENRRLAENYTWDKIRARYVEAWKELLN